MKYLFLALIGLSFFTSCKEVLEVNTVTQKSVKDSSFVVTSIEAAQLKNVLIEEFTGVKCQNCPQGHVIVNDLKVAHPERIISVSMHSSFQGGKYTFSPYDFTTEEAEFIDKKFVSPSKPSAMVDRIKNTGALVMSRTEWTPASEVRLGKTTPVNIHIENEVEKDSLIVKVKLHFTEEVLDALKYSVYLTESNIINPQLMPTFAIDTFYNHKDVLRAMVGNMEGNSISDKTEKGRVIVRYLKCALKSEYKKENLHVVAAVHKSGAVEEVLHCEEVKVVK